MQQSQVPAKFLIPWGHSATPSYIRDIPQGSQVGIVNGAASLETGFPPLNFQPVGSGGVPPFGQDMNGILRQLTQWARWQAAGGLNLWDGPFAAAIGGYPRNALLSSTTPGLAWLSATENNATNPDSGTASGWLPVMTGASVPQTSLIHTGDDTSAAPGVITLPVITPALSGLASGLIFEIVPRQDIVGPTNVQIATFGSLSLKRNDGSDPVRGDGPAGQPFLAAIVNGVLRKLGASPSEILPPVALWHVATAGGTASALTIAASAVTPAVVSDQDLMPFLIRTPLGVSSGATLAITTVSGSTISGALQRNDGGPIQDGDAPVGGEIVVVRHGNAFRLTSFGRMEVQRLVPNPVIWVRADGNDNNDGSANDAAHAKQSLGAALSQGTSAFNFSTSALAIRLGMPGNYLSPQYIPVASGLIRIIGDEAARDNYVIYGNGSVAQGMLQGAGTIEIRGVKLQNNGTDSHVLVGTAGANILCLNTTIAVAQATSGNHVLAAGGQVTLGAGCVITGNSASLAVGASGGEVIFNSNANIQLQGSPAFSVAAVRADNLGRITLLGGAQVTGGASGQRYLVGNYSIILTTGAGENAFPGSSPGVVSSTGIYQ